LPRDLTYGESYFAYAVLVDLKLLLAKTLALVLLASTLFVSLVYYAESIVRWFVVREKHYWMAADSADKSKRTGCRLLA
jgi:hypothetical protein